MQRPRAIIIAGLIAAGAFGLAAHAAAQYRHGVVFYGDATAPVWDLAASRYDFGILGYETSLADDAFQVKARNPQFKWYTYNSISDDYVALHPSGMAEYEDLVARAAAHGWDVDDCYLHFVDDTQLVIDGVTVSVPGWGGGTAASREAARVPVFYSDLSRRVTCLVGRGGLLRKEAIVARHFDAPIGNTNVFAAGVFLDNAGHRLWNTGTVVHGGHVAEAAGQPVVGSNAFFAWYWGSNLRPFLTALRDTAQSLGREVMINVGDDWNDDYVNFHVADSVTLESWYSPALRDGPGRVMEARQRDAAASAAGMSLFYLAYVTTSVSGGSGSYGYDEAALGNVAWWLTTRSPETALFLKGTYDTASPVWGTNTWIAAIDTVESRLGGAEGEPAVVASGVDPEGHAYDVVGRSYAGGMSLVRNRGSYNQNIGPQTAVTVTLPQPMHRLAPDGTSGPLVTATTLRNGEGAVLVLPDQSGGGDPEPDPPPAGILAGWVLAWLDASPQPAAVGVPARAEIRCLFSEPLGSPGAAWITATGSVSGAAAGSVLLEDGGRRLVFRAASGWAPGERVTVSLSPAISTQAGTRLDGNGDGTGTGGPEDGATFSFTVTAP